MTLPAGAAGEVSRDGFRGSRVLQYLGQLSHGETQGVGHLQGQAYLGGIAKQPTVPFRVCCRTSKHTVLALIINWRLKILILQENEIKTQKTKQYCKRGINGRMGCSSEGSKSSLVRNSCQASVRILLKSNTMLKFLGFIANPKLDLHSTEFAKFWLLLAARCMVSGLSLSFRSSLFFTLLQSIT